MGKWATLEQHVLKTPGRKSAGWKGSDRIGNRSQALVNLRQEVEGGDSRARD